MEKILIENDEKMFYDVKRFVENWTKAKYEQK